LQVAIHASLEVLNLARNSLTSASGCLIAEALETNIILTELDICQNALGQARAAIGSSFLLRFLCR